MDSFRFKSDDQINHEYLAKGIDLTSSATLSKVPTVVSVSPSSGSTAGGTSITITGTNLNGATAVKVGGTAVVSFTKVSATQIVATTAAHTAGVASVNVTTTYGVSAANSLFSYITPTPSGNVSTRIGPTIHIQNNTTVLSDAQLQAAIAALQIQLDRDWQPVWGTTATLSFVSKTGTVPSTGWVIYMMDTSDIPGALGYHDETAAGRPIGKVFAKDDMRYGYNWTVTLSHELLEMMLDPYINQTVFAQDSVSSGLLYAYEACDAVEADSLGYTINGILVSDFVYPTWFDLTITNYHGVKFDYCNRLTAPFQLWSGGYIGVFPVPNDGSGWSSINAQNIIGPPDDDDMVSTRARDRRSRS